MAHTGMPRRFLDMPPAHCTSLARLGHDSARPNQLWRHRPSSGYWYPSYEPEIP